MIVRSGTPVRIIQSFIDHKPQTPESRNDCSDGGECTARAKRISSGTIEASGVDHDDMLPPTNSCTLQHMVLLMYFNQTFGNGTPPDISKGN
jgi:hypothetical protein